jgi:hypothetical protein
MKFRFGMPPKCDVSKLARVPPRINQSEASPRGHARIPHDDVHARDRMRERTACCFFHARHDSKFARADENDPARVRGVPPSSGTTISNVVD